MNCIPTALHDFVFVAGLLLCVLGVASLVVSILRARESRVGAELIEACAGDMPTVEKAISNVRAENEYMRDMLVYGSSAMHVDAEGHRRRVRRFHDEDAS